MDDVTFHRRGWITAAIAPAACVLFLLGQEAGLWDGGSRLYTVLAGVLMVEMIVGTAAPFWWLLTAFRRRGGVSGPSKALIAANAAALLIGVVCFF